MKVSLIQQKYHGTKEETIARTLEMIKEAKGELVVLQELHQSDYFCKSENTKYFELASDIKKDIEFWKEVSKIQDIVLVTSLFEKRAEGLYHNTAYVFDKGKLAGKYRKMHIPDDPGYYEKFYFTPGDLGFEPIDTSVGRLGVLVCWDQWYPEAARIMALKGADVLIYPTAIGWLDENDQVIEDDEEKIRQLESWITVQRGHAIANGLPVITVNRVGYEVDESGVLGGTTFWGNSFVVGVQGEFIAKGDFEEEVIEAEIDLNRTREFRNIWPFFRDRRVEHYKCLKNIYCDKK